MPPLRWPVVSRAMSRPPVTGSVAGRGPQGDSANRGRRQARAGESGQRRPASPARLGSVRPAAPPCPGTPALSRLEPRETGKDTPASPGEHGGRRTLRRVPGVGQEPGRELVGPGGTRETDEGLEGGGAGRASWGHGRAPWIEVSRFPRWGAHHSPSLRGWETEGGGWPLHRGRVHPPAGAHRLLSKTPSSCRRQSRVWAPETARLGRRRARAGPRVCSAASAQALLRPRSARDTDTLPSLASDRT